MVPVLDDELGELVPSVVGGAGQEHRDLGDLCPHDESGLVAEIVEALVVLVVGKAHSGHAELAQQRQVGLLHLLGDRIADAFPVLMPGHASQRVLLTVEEETALGIDRELPASEAHRHLVDGRTSAEHLGPGRVEVGVLQAVPAANVVDGQLRRGLAAGDRNGDGAFAVDGEADLCPVACAGEPCAQCDLSLLALERRGDGDTGTTVLCQRHVGGVNADLEDFAIDPTVEREVRLLRVHRRVRCVVDDDQQCAGPVRQMVGNVHAERRVAAVVSRQQNAVEMHLGRGVHPGELDPCPTAGYCTLDAAGVGGTATAVLAAGLSVHGIPGVRKGDLFAGRRDLLDTRARGQLHRREGPPFEERLDVP